MQQLTLALPDLAWPHPQAALPALHTPGLNRLLHWGRSQSQPAAINSAFFGCFLWQGSLLKQGLQALGLPENQAAFWCSPVHQHIGMHSAQIISGNTLAIQADEAAAWCAELSRFFADQHWHFYPYRADLWLVSCPQPPQWQAAPILDLNHHLDAANKPSGHGANALLQAQTEMQMLLHSHALNHARQQHGLPPVNGVWCWRDATGEADPHTLLLTDSAWAQNSLPLRHTLPSSWTELQNQYTASGSPIHTVMFDDSLMLPVAQGDGHTYAAQLQDWDQRWFMPAHHALASGSLKQLCISSQHTDLWVRKPAIPPFWRPQPVFQGAWL